MGVEYAGILAAVSLMAITLTGAYGKNVSAVFESSGVGITAVGKAAKAQKVAPAGAKAAYKRAPYVKPALKYLYALGWIGGTRNPGGCGLTLLGEGAARDQAAREMRSNTKLVAQLKKRALSVSAAANAVTKGVVSACA
jgi:Flp pilus assembly pilin Flp